MSTFFPHLPPDHRDLHSFPTRRSSDLTIFRAGAFETTILKEKSNNIAMAGARPTREGFDIRSEEHTSELQSHHDLVCRLLLEKKKNKSSHILVLHSTICTSLGPL